jgi:hypothetical protein
MNGLTARRIIMTGCRISEEDARDPYFDGEELTVEELKESMREDFEVYALDIQELSQGLLQDGSWLPDTDDIEAALHLIQHLRYYYLQEQKNG